jgi:CBS domain-containing protein
MKCSEIMSVQFRTVGPSDTVLSAVTLMRDDFVHFVPVCEADGHPVGLVNDYDVIGGVSKCLAITSRWVA